MNDPLQNSSVTKVKLEAGDVSGLKFAKLHSPKMKSVYWRHFGYPVNDEDNIITKQNVVCTLCHKVLTNHGNTTNLRAHLQHRHKEQFARICTENGIKVPPRRPPTKYAQHMRTFKREPVERVRQIKLEYISTEDSTNVEMGDEQSMLYESLVPMTYDDDEAIDADHFAKVEVGGNHSDVKNVEMLTTTNYRLDETMDPSQLQDALVNMLIQDMMNVDSMYDPGMSHFVRTLCGNVAMPTEKKIETLIRELHSDKLTTLSDQIKVHSQVKPFSLGFEIWTNVEHKHFLSVYYNYTTDAPEYNLMNQLYCSLEYNKFTSVDAVFEEFNLNNCTAAIVSYDYDDYLKHFLKNKGIPIILSYDVTIDKCLKGVFALPAVASVYAEVKEVIMRYTSEIHSKDVVIPTLNEEFPWTYYELLKFFSETVSWPEDVDVLVASARAVVEALSTLAVTLDTLKGEEIPHSSMLSPITSKILNKKLSVTQNDDQLVASIKAVLAEELEKLVISDEHLTISALLDPRFHRLTNITNFSSCLQFLTEKFNKLCEIEGRVTASSTVEEVSAKPTTPNAKKSNLELFFDIQENSNSAVRREESNVESDLKRYRNEVYVSLDESPFMWWNKMGHLYGSLKQLASLYQCVPCVVNMNFKKPIKQQIYEHQKRFMLSGSLIDATLFLHYNSKCND